ncbi:FAD-dependent monooxygenase [Streptomyces coeruleorubidus]|uniref:FAD-dependent monooxygenase n=1 Tax=Streptomyces coeruleorubidus TaxID=116188 RepID=UPI003660E888
MEKTEVVVVGSGPTGLLLAAELALAGVDDGAQCLRFRAAGAVIAGSRTAAARSPRRPPMSSRKDRAGVLARRPAR